MTRKSVLLSLALLVSLPLSCAVYSEVKVDRPPKEGGLEAELWWERTVDSLPLNFLAVYAAASEVHLKKKTSTVYVDWYDGIVKGGVTQHELQIPSPPPDMAFSRIRERLKDYKPAEDKTPDRRHDHVIVAEQCQVCTYPQAMDIWHDADKKINPAKAKPPSTAPATRPANVP
jgi:hypothetical protein